MPSFFKKRRPVAEPSVRVNEDIGHLDGNGKSAELVELPQQHTTESVAEASNVTRDPAALKTSSDEKGTAASEIHTIPETEVEKLKAEGDDDDEKNYPGGTQLALLTFGLCMATFVVALDNTVRLVTSSCLPRTSRY
jgi:hypothetical protein